MKSIAKRDLWSMCVAAVILILVLIVAFMTLQLYRLKEGERNLYGTPSTHGTHSTPSTPSTHEGFWANLPYYFPDGPPNKSGRGLTVGMMPSMETDYLWGDTVLRTCCGRIGIPP